MRPGLETDFFSLPRPRPMAHRGASGTHPENTMAAFTAAYEVGARYFELDVHMTRDGVIVVHHDDGLERTCGRPGLIREMSWAEVAAADAGYNFRSNEERFPFRGAGIGIPALAEVVAAFSGIRFVVEIKQVAPSLAAELLGVIDRAGMRRRVLIASEHQKPLDEFRALAPAIPTSFSTGEVGRFVQAMPSGMAGYRAPADALQIPTEYESFKLATPELVDAAHRVGVEVHIWTVNAESEMRELLALGVDGIITDFPARLLALL